MAALSFHDFARLAWNLHLWPNSCPDESGALNALDDRLVEIARSASAFCDRLPVPECSRKEIPMSELSRRGFLQTASFLVGGAYAHAVFGEGTRTPPAFAAKPAYQPTALFLTWQRDPTTTMTIQWVGEEKEAVERPIWYAKRGANIWQQKTGTARRFPLTNRWILRTELSGLEPGTDYRFHVGLDSAEEKFRTMPAKATETIHFVSGGDSGINKHAVATNHVAAAQSPMFVVMSGDIAYEDAKSPEIFLQFLKNYSRDLRDAQGRMIPLFGGIGNHEVLGRFGRPRHEAPFFYAVFDGLYPETGYASLDFGDYLSLVFLDSNHTSPVAGAQSDWLDKTLKAREEMPTVFAFNHVPSYPSVRHDGRHEKDRCADRCRRPQALGAPL